MRLRALSCHYCGSSRRVGLHVSDDGTRWPLCARCRGLDRGRWLRHMLIPLGIAGLLITGFEECAPRDPIYQRAGADLTTPLVR